MSVPSTSPSLATQHRLSARRGSASALDPFNIHTALNRTPNRVSSSTLTIVRVTSPPAASPSSLHEPPTSPVLSQRRLHRRHGSGATNSSTSSQPAAESSPQPTRLSFASSSFSSAGPAHGGPSSVPNRERPQSPSSPRLRPSSPRLSASSPFSAKPRLTPDQLVDLARQSTNPRTLAQAATSPHFAPVSPVVLSHSPILSPHTSASSQSQTQTVAPATFTPLPDDIYLPFIDRPSEVASLISSPPDARLFTLLAQTLGKKEADPDAPLEQPSDLPTNPADWTYRHLVFHLTKVDRDVAPDPIWAYAARKCIISHSELIWERVKDALGIPPELDIDWDFDRDNAIDSDGSSIRTEDISDDEGRAARGHWSDWDATIDSPVFSRKNKRLSMESHDSHEGITIGTFSPSVSTRHEVDPENHIVIEPLIAPPPSFSSAPPPLSLPSSLATGPSDGLGDIAEGAEEEEEEAEGGQKESKPAEASSSSTQAQTDPGLLSPPQIQGLKISTSPLPVTHHDISPMLSPVSPVPSIPGAITVPGTNSGGNVSAHVGPKSHNRSSSFSSIGPFRRSESSSSIGALLSNSRSANPGAGSDAGDTSSVLSELHLNNDLVGDHRAAGNPLFPSNFARLSGAPTLKSR